MRTKKRRYLLGVCAGMLLMMTACSVVSGSRVHEAAQLCVYGPADGYESGAVMIDNQSEASSMGEMLLMIDKEHTLVLEAENGYPVEPEQIQPGEMVYAYIGEAMTMSLPPQVSADLVLCQIPENGSVPEYVQVSGVKKEKEGGFVLKAGDDKSYQVPQDCEILPYRTKQMITVNDIQRGSHCLLWMDGDSRVTKIVLFTEQQ